jgi:hypothetical protein
MMMNTEEFFQKYERLPIELTEVKIRKMYGMIDQENEIYYPQVIATNSGEVLYSREPIRVWSKDVGEGNGFIELFPSSRSSTISSNGYTLHETKPSRSKSSAKSRSKSPAKSRSKSPAKSKKGGSRKTRKGGRR